MKKITPVRYADRGYKKVEGWSPKLAFTLIAEVAAIQDRWQIKGPVCEIGVHHGQLLIFLHFLTRDGEKTVGWDLFDRQDENPYRSGNGSREITEKHLRAFGCDPALVDLHQANSLELTVEQLKEHCGGRPRLFSIDGGHTADVVCNDLMLAAQTICKDGVVILDDLFCEPFPDVGQGFYDYMKKDGTLTPFLIGGNKVFLAGSEAAADRYLKAMPLEHRHHETRQTQFYGRNVMVVIRPYSPVRYAMRHSRLWKILRRQPVFEGLLARWKQWMRGDTGNVQASAGVDSKTVRD